MEQATAITKFVRMCPRKARLVATLIRGKEVATALEQLQFANCKPARVISKTLLSAIANAETQMDVQRDNLKVAYITIGEGPRLKRSKPKNKGGSHGILKRMSHVTVVVQRI